MARMISIGAALLVMAGLFGWAMTDETASSTPDTTAKAAASIDVGAMMEKLPTDRPVKLYSDQ